MTTGETSRARIIRNHFDMELLTMFSKALICMVFAVTTSQLFAGIPGVMTCSNDDPRAVHCPPHTTTGNPGHIISTPAPRQVSTFLHNDEEAISFKQINTPQGSVEMVVLEDFLNEARQPAIVRDAGSYNGLPLAVLERDNKRVLVVSRAHFVSPTVSRYLADNCVGAVLGGGLAGAGLGAAGGVVTAAQFTDELPDPRISVLGKLIGATVGGIGGFVAGATTAWGTAASCQPAPASNPKATFTCTFEPNPPKAKSKPEGGQ